MRGFMRNFVSFTLFCFGLCFGLMALVACQSPTEGGSTCADRSLRLATTTSVDNTGLLKRLIEPFKARTGITVQVVAVGTGQALKLAANGTWKPSIKSARPGCKPSIGTRAQEIDRKIVQEVRANCLERAAVNPLPSDGDDILP